MLGLEPAAVRGGGEWRETGARADGYTGVTTGGRLEPELAAIH